MGLLNHSIHEKIQSLTPEQLTEVEALIAALQAEDQERATRSLSEPAFAAVWNDPANDVYDAL